MSRLFIVTNDYPYGDGDSNFVLPELRYLKKLFHITVISTSNKENVAAELLEDVEYKHFQLNLTIIKKLIYFFCFFVRKSCWKELNEIISNSKENKIGRIYKAIEFFACAEEFYGFLKKELHTELSEGRGIFLNYWCNAYSLSLILHPGKYKDLKRTTRLHGCDIYEDRYSYGRQPFKKVINAGMDKLFFVSYNAREYYLRIHSDVDKRKTLVASLGVEKKFPRSSDEENKGFFLLVSCSNIISLKRVELIIEALALLTLEIPIKWVHFGDGSQGNEIMLLAKEKLKDKRKISYCFEGNVENEVVKKFYCEQRPDCFITTSSTEGCPVSVMEALACGLPVIGTSVGDIPFMIDGNGYLLSADPEVGEVADAIDKMINVSSEEKIRMREQSVNIWNKRYNREKNEKLFLEMLRDLLN